MIFIVARHQIAKILKRYLGTTNLKKAIQLSEIQNQETPKSLSGMESIAIPLINKDFPDLNINELKRLAESSIISYLNILESKEYKEIDNSSDKVKGFIKSRLADLNKKDTVRYDSIKVHKTIINKYENNNGIATIYFQTSLEYMYKKNDEPFKKIQDRFVTEFIYIIDTDKLGRKIKAIGLNCPNCGAIINNIGNKRCNYCGTGIVDIVSRTWYLNNVDSI